MEYWLIYIIENFIFLYFVGNLLDVLFNLKCYLVLVIVNGFKFEIILMNMYSLVRLKYWVIYGSWIWNVELWRFNFFFVSIYNNLWCIELVVFIIKDKVVINNWGYFRKLLCRVVFNFNLMIKYN